jgi:hypothetical protein
MVVGRVLWWGRRGIRKFLAGLRSGLPQSPFLD